MAEFVEESHTDVCEIEGCDRETDVRLDVPWDRERDVCAAHARTWVQKKGVVAMPLEEAEDDWL
jgi:hypothetical protein